MYSLAIVADRDSKDEADQARRTSNADKRLGLINGRGTKITTNDRFWFLQQGFCVVRTGVPVASHFNKSDISFVPYTVVSSINNSNDENNNNNAPPNKENIPSSKAIDDEWA